MRGVGVPRFKMSAEAYRDAGESRGRFRDSYHARGSATPLSNLRRRTLEFAVGDHGGALGVEGAWEGMSGALVWSEDCVVGVISAHYPAEGPMTLTASRADRWHESLHEKQIEQLHDLIGLPVDESQLVDVGLPGGAPEIAVSMSLPRDIPSFTGRGRELDLLTSAVERGDAPGPILAISAVDGMAGAGKTAFAVHAAHLLAHRFPDGQVFVRLHAHTPGVQAADPADTLQSMLLADGVAPSRIPDDLQARESMWRSRTAGRRMLVLLDDAASSNQIRPLLPSSASSLVLITSRRRLIGLEDATPVSLSVLPRHDAIELFARITKRERPELAPDDDAVIRLVEICGRLPLALRMVAARLVHHPRWSVADLLDELSQAEDRLTELNDDESSVAMAFDLSYRDLSEEAQRVLRYLGLPPGADIDVYGAAALLGADLGAMRRLLRELEENHLIEEPARGRYQMHDLVRQYSRARGARDDAGMLTTCLDRLFDYYLSTAYAADRHLTRHRNAYTPSPDHPPAYQLPLTSYEQAMAWFAAEIQNLAACIRHSARSTEPAHAVALSATVNGYLRIRGPWDTALQLHGLAAEAAQRLGDGSGYANALTDKGSVLQLTGDVGLAASLLEQAHELFRANGNQLGEANALTALGDVRMVAGEYSAAIVAHERALEIYRTLEFGLGQANTLADLGAVRYMKGEYDEASADLHRALEIFRTADDRLGEANSLKHLGAVQSLTGDYTGAIASLERSASLFRERGSWRGEANALADLGFARRLTGDYAGAGADLERSLELHRQLANVSGEAETLIELGGVRRQSGDLSGASEKLVEALELFGQLGNQSGKGSALAEIGITRQAGGDFPGSLTELESALAIFQTLGNLGGVAEILGYIARAHTEMGRYAIAMQQFTQALGIAREIGSPQDEAFALEGIGECDLLDGRPDAGLEHLRQALVIYEELGVPDAARVRDRLSG